MSSATRLLTYAVPALWLSTRPGLQLRHLWLLGVATVGFQAVLSVWMLLSVLAKTRVPRAAV